MKQFFYFLSKTDTDLLIKGPRSAEMQQASLGFFVLMTGFFAWCSGTFAISTLFNEYDPVTGKASITTYHQTISMIIGFIYCLMIMAIDREIVSTSSKWTVVPRFLLAAIIGVVVAVPIEMKILEDSILKSIDKRNVAENKPLENAEDMRIAVYDQELNRINEKMQTSRDQAANWSTIMEQEATGKPGPGRTGVPGRKVHYEEAKRNYELWSGHVKSDSLEFVKKNSERDSLVQEVREKIRIQSTKASYGFYAMYKELQLMLEEDTTSATAKLTWGICLLFVFIELTPAFIKLIRSKSEYDAALETRRRINISGMHKEGNDAMVDIARSNGTEDHPEYVSKMKSRIRK